MKIRRMQESDIEIVYELGSRAEEFSITSDSGNFWDRGVLEDWLQSSDDVLLVAEEEGKIIGFALSQFHLPTKKGTIENVYVAERYRGSGLGKNLLTNIVGELRNQGAEYFCALVKVDNEASKALLKKCGFQKGYDFTWMAIY